MSDPLNLLVSYGSFLIRLLGFESLVGFAAFCCLRCVPAYLATHRSPSLRGYRITMMVCHDREKKVTGMNACLNIFVVG